MGEGPSRGTKGCTFNKKTIKKTFYPPKLKRRRQIKRNLVAYKTNRLKALPEQYG